MIAGTCRKHAVAYALLVVCATCVETSAEELYNGIVLPTPWPPQGRPVNRDPMDPPYLKSPPKVIPIDVGRQLFVDDFLVDQTALKRTYHAATYHPASPLVRPDKAWEKEGNSPCAMVFSDGVWYDPKDKLFKMWYMGGYVKGTCYATSRDGLHWEKPELDVRPGTNVVHTTLRDSSTVWMDLQEKDPKRRYKLVCYPHPNKRPSMCTYFSPDGIHWSELAGESGKCGDRTSVFFNPFRNVWVMSIRDYSPKGIGRARRYWEHADILEAIKWPDEKAPFWIGADTRDKIRPELKTPPELYNLDAAAYESLIVGLFSIWYGQPKDRAKPNELCVGFTRDGFHWYRPGGTPFIGVSERYGDFNWANIQSAGGCCLVVGDQLYFYVSTRAGVKGSANSGECTTSLAVLRRDGFASMDAGDEPGTLTTRTVRFKGRHLFVNADADEGELTAEVVDADGQVIAPYGRENCQPVRTDKTMQAVQWSGGKDLSDLAGKPVRFRFHLKKARLFAFWVSPDVSGASYGYVAAGGPGFSGPIDTGVSGGQP